MVAPALLYREADTATKLQRCGYTAAILQTHNREGGIIPDTQIRFDSTLQPCKLTE